MTSTNTAATPYQAGSKAAAVSVVYTPWANLLKLHRMEVGQVGFKDQSQVRHVRDVTKMPDVIRRLVKTRREETAPDLAAERAVR